MRLADRLGFGVSVSVVHQEPAYADMHNQYMFVLDMHMTSGAWTTGFAYHAGAHHRNSYFVSEMKAAFYGALPHGVRPCCRTSCAISNPNLLHPCSMSFACGTASIPVREQARTDELKGEEKGVPERKLYRKHSSRCASEPLGVELGVE